ncbi:hypothetical protein DRQ16_00995 [bacterium]|nr:MAG: hypothetical protein DRQ16_00995 [bacterium]
MKILKDILFLAGGSAIASLGYVLFLIPFRISPGGVSGVSIVLYHTLKVPFGVSYFALNVPIFLWGVRVLGIDFGLKTILGTVLLSLFPEFFQRVLHLGAITENSVIASVYGGMLLGAGLGFVLKGKGSTGGTDILGRIMNRYTGLSTGVSILIIDSFVILLSAWTFRTYELALLGYIALFISSKMIDIILEGRDYAKAVYIFTNREKKIGERIMKELKRGATLLEGKGMFTQERRGVIFCVIHRRQEERIKEIVEEEDPEAFIVISDVHEVLGKGFPRRKE